jgi:hypothetical protein
LANRPAWNAHVNEQDADYKEYLRLGLDDPVRRVAWLANVNKNAAATAVYSMGETRGATYKHLQAAYYEYIVLHNRSKRP